MQNTDGTLGITHKYKGATIDLRHCKVTLHFSFSDHYYSINLDILAGCTPDVDQPARRPAMDGGRHTVEFRIRIQVHINCTEQERRTHETAPCE